MLSTLVFWLNNNAGRCSHVCICRPTCLYGRSTRELSVSCIYPPPPRSLLPKYVFGLLAVASATLTTLPYHRPPPPPPLHIHTKIEHRLLTPLLVLASSKRAHYYDLHTLNHRIYSFFILFELGCCKLCIMCIGLSIVLI